MLAHTQRAASHGAKATALTAVFAALARAAFEAGAGTSEAAASFTSVALKYAPVGLLAGALAGAIGFGLIGFCVALLGVKRVGWTFTYTIFGAALFALAVNFFHPLIENVPATFIGVAAAAALAALTGAISGYFVASALKSSPDA